MTLDLHERRASSSSDPNSLWAGRQLYELYAAGAHALGMARADLRARRANWACIASARRSTTPRSTSSRRWTCPAYKIASFENIDLPLIRRVAAHRQADDHLHRHGQRWPRSTRRCAPRARPAAATSSCSSAPAPTRRRRRTPTSRTIPHLRELFGCEVGLSDHTMGSGVAVAAVALGATVIEKHFTLRRADGGVDSRLLAGAGRAARAGASRPSAPGRRWAGSATAAPQAETEVAGLPPLALHRRGHEGRRGADAAEPARGAPRHGPASELLRAMLGKRVNRDVKKGTPVSFDLVS